MEWSKASSARLGTISHRHLLLPWPQIIGPIHLGIWNLHTVQGVMDGSGNPDCLSALLSYPSQWAAEPSILSCLLAHGRLACALNPRSSPQLPSRASLWGPSEGNTYIMPHSVPRNSPPQCLPGILIAKPWMAPWTWDAEGAPPCCCHKGFLVLISTNSHSKMCIECLQCTWHSIGECEHWRH